MLKKFRLRPDLDSQHCFQINITDTTVKYVLYRTRYGNLMNMQPKEQLVLYRETTVTTLGSSVGLLNFSYVNLIIKFITPPPPPPREILVGGGGGGEGVGLQC